MTLLGHLFPKHWFKIHVPPVVSLYRCSFSGRLLYAWRTSGPCGRLMTSVSSVGGIPCSFTRLIHTLSW